MSKFYTAFDRPPRASCPAGEAVQPVLEEKIVDGVRQLAQVGETNVDDFIQASLSDTLIYNILAKVDPTDPHALDLAPTSFGDVVGLPTNLAQAQQQLIDMENRFATMPMEIRKKFDNSLDQFVQALSDGTAEPAIRDYLASQGYKDEVKEESTVES